MDPAVFWTYTLAEVALRLRSFEDADRREWQRTAHQLSLLYNINRGKAQALTWEDFTPYGKEQVYTPPTKMTGKLRTDLFRMGNTMRDGTRH